MNGGNKKRKRQLDEVSSHDSKKRSTVSNSQRFLQGQVSQLEDELSKSPEDEEKVSELLKYLGAENANDSENAIVAVTLCRSFIRSMTTSPFSTKALQGVGKLYRDYRLALRRLLSNGDSSYSSTWLELQMKILKAEAEYLNVVIWESDEFYNLIEILVEKGDTAAWSELFIAKFLRRYNDVLFYFCRGLSNVLSMPQTELMMNNSISILSKIGDAPSASDDLATLFIPPSRSSRKTRITPSSMKRAAQSAWLAILRQPSLSTSSRKTLLHLVAPVVSPWFIKPELLMDFLTDSYDLGGSQALIAISGLYQLISTKNLDYPSFYPKLYSLLDAQLFHSTQRSRFFRLLQTFLSSSHLPATLIASFIKRLARLALSAPPAAIVTVIPYIYNLLKDNPATTFMIHRSRSPDPFRDPFNASEPDPLLTNAIDSSLWELQSLQSHYHPNVASIARIIGEQFTKQQYNIEDFLDHSYGSIIAAELVRDPKKAPIVEWKIRKNILETSVDKAATGDIEENTNPLLQVWGFDA